MNKTIFIIICMIAWVALFLSSEYPKYKHKNFTSDDEYQEIGR